MAQHTERGARIVSRMYEQTEWARQILSEMRDAVMTERQRETNHKHERVRRAHTAGATTIVRLEAMLILSMASVKRKGKQRRNITIATPPCSRKAPRRADSRDADEKTQTTKRMVPDNLRAT